MGFIAVLYGGMNFYIGLRLWQFLGQRVSAAGLRVFLAVFILIAVSGLLSVAGRGFLPDFLRSSLSNGIFWLPAMVYFLFFFVFIDVIRALIGFFNKYGLLMPVGSMINSNSLKFGLGISAIVFVAVILIYGIWNAKDINIVSYEISIAKADSSPDLSLNIVLASDFHLSAGQRSQRKGEKIIKAINSLSPDLIVIPGDIIDDAAYYEQHAMAADLAGLQSKYGVYATLGNHDYMNRDFEKLLKILDEAGVRLLRDSGVKVTDSFYILGREDVSSGRQGGGRRAALTEIIQGIDPGFPIILLEHQPVDLNEAANAGVDLLLAGHTHKGQFFPVNLITHRIFQVDYGYLTTEGLQIVVTSGASTWGPPIRIGSKCEIVQIHLHAITP